MGEVVSAEPELCRCGHLRSSHGVESDSREPNEVCEERGCPCERFVPMVQAEEPEPSPDNLVQLHAVVESNWSSFIADLLERPDLLRGAVLVLPACKKVYCIGMSQNDVIAEMTRALHEILDGSTKGPWSF